MISLLVSLSCMPYNYHTGFSHCVVNLTPLFNENFSTVLLTDYNYMISPITFRSTLANKRKVGNTHQTQ